MITIFLLIIYAISIYNNAQLPFLWGFFSLHSLHKSLGILDKSHHAPKDIQFYLIFLENQPCVIFHIHVDHCRKHIKQEAC